MSGSGISWAICKSAPHSRQITTPAPHHSVFYRPDALPAAQPTASKHWRHFCICICTFISRHIICRLAEWSNEVTSNVCHLWLLWSHSSVHCCYWAAGRWSVSVLSARFTGEMWNLQMLWTKAKKQHSTSGTLHHSIDSTSSMQYVFTC